MGTWGTGNTFIFIFGIEMPQKDLAQSPVHLLRHGLGAMVEADKGVVG